jgi:hypothetical protein
MLLGGILVGRFLDERRRDRLLGRCASCSPP